MKKYLIGILCLFGSLGLQAQLPSNGTDTSPASLDSLLQSEMRLNLAVPNNPAFMALNNQSINLLRPSNPKDFSVAISQFIQQGELILPQNFGMEFSPIMILENGGLIKDSTKVQGLLPLRFSLGTVASKDSLIPNLAERVGMGLHYTFEKKGSSFQGYKETLRRVLQPLTDDYEARVDSLRKVYYRKMGITPMVLASVTEDSLAKIVAARNIWADSVYTTLGDKTISKGDFDAAVRATKTKYKRETWNDFRLDLATAIVIRSPDTIARISLDSSMVADTIARLQGANFWTSCSFPMFGTNYLQGLAGLGYAVSRPGVDSAYKSILTLNGRVYVGSNRIKGFVEGQYQMNNMTNVNTMLANVGMEINIYDGIWVHFFVGLSNNLDQGRTRMISNFNFNLALPERFKLN